ncbi:hypothetical protein E2C01_017336 [Portunus trituberculatus]|uniref:Uncharacterized protein n=1 Tax=Portunus trituberculatus TaxID=210409 RepID=A0A5B7DT31_PORTR|nr:hypothetical protein [Portunus trituberculatus]
MVPKRLISDEIRNLVKLQVLMSHSTPFVDSQESRTPETTKIFSSLSDLPPLLSYPSPAFTYGGDCPQRYRPPKPSRRKYVPLGSTNNGD